MSVCDPSMIQMKGKYRYCQMMSRALFTMNHRYETITDLMHLQDQIESFQKLIFTHIHQSANSECKISALVPLVAESYGIYKFCTSMLRAMHSCR